MKRTTELAVTEFKEVHGDKYNYDKYIFISTKTKGIITCSIHGDFEQSFDKHKYGNGCPKCGKKERKTNEEIISEFKEVHGEKYDYSLMEYKNVDTKIKIICPTHGVFEQSPYSHGKQGKGCPKCSGKNLTKTELVKEFKMVHGNKYDYKNMKIVHFREKITVTCKDHGDFKILATNHKAGKGCPKCAGKNLTNTEWISKFKQVHGEIYSYKKFDFKATSVKSIFICKEHGEFEATPSMHIRGRGCPCCAKTGFDQKKPAILYYLKVERKGSIAFKVGITNNDLKTRFGKDLAFIKPLKIETFENGKDAYEKEQKILKKFAHLKWKGQRLLKNGNTELFTCDVLKLDKVN